MPIDSTIFILFLPFLWHGYCSIQKECVCALFFVIKRIFNMYRYSSLQHCNALHCIADSKEKNKVKPKRTYEVWINDIDEWNWWFGENYMFGNKKIVVIFVAAEQRIQSCEQSLVVSRQYANFGYTLFSFVTSCNALLCQQHTNTHTKYGHWIDVRLNAIIFEPMLFQSHIISLLLFPLIS